MKPKVLLYGVTFLIPLAGLHFFVRPEPIKRSAICAVHMRLRADGVVFFDGTQFPDDEKLKTKLASYKKENPDCFLSVVSDEGVQPASVEHVAGIMRQAGFNSVGFITEPHSLRH